MAIASLISAASGLMCCTFGGPVGLGLGIAALVQIRKDPARYGGKEMAIAGIILGCLPILLFVLYIVFILLGTLG